MSATRYLKLFGTDWRDGTRALSPEARSLYLDLLTLMNERDDARVPDDVPLLCRWLSYKRQRTLERPLDELVRAGKIRREGGWLHNARLSRDAERRQAVADSYAPHPPPVRSRPAVVVDNTVGPPVGNPGGGSGQRREAGTNPRVSADLAGTSTSQPLVNAHDPRLIHESRISTLEVEGGRPGENRARGDPGA